MNEDVFKFNVLFKMGHFPMPFVSFPGCFSSVNGDDLSHVQIGAPRPIQEDEIPDLVC